MLDRLRLAAVPGLSPRLVARLVADIGSAGSVFTARRERIAAVRGVGDARASLLAGAPSRDDVLRDVERARAASAVVVVPGCPGWPLVLDELPDPPSALWGRGDLVAALAAAPPGPGGLAPEWIDVLRTRGVGIVGSRKASSYGLAQAERLGHDLAAMGITVVSGLARGIDAAAHRGALRAGGRTVGVLGGGLARFYPPENVSLAREMVAAGGAVVSEFPLDMPPLPHHFPRRNRLIAALSAAVVVVEAAERSGSLLTADHALDLGREVLAVPGRVDQPNSRGVHRLLREGAALCESAADVLTALGIELPGSGAPDVSTPASGAGRTGAPPNAATPTGRTPTEQALLDALADEERDADALIDATGLPPSAGLVALSALELRGVVRIAGDGRYEIVRSI
ncbi:MAG: DNA-processing protein DprA [Planctomycetes bacterium]|nr:DNA-processing protein DprA [Planctomycetota bacterium]